MENRFMKVACLTVLMMGSGLRAMDVNPVDKQRLNMELRSAAGNGNKKKVEDLIAQGAAVNDQNKSGVSALMMAAEDGHRKVCELLFAQGADVNLRDKDGSTALILAAFMGHKKVCLLLIAHGANLYVQDKYGETVLMKAALGEQEEVCKLLINEMIKPTKEQVDSIVALLGSSKKKRSEQLNVTTHDVVKLIGRERYNVFRQENRTNARNEIMKIKQAGLRKELLGYLNTL